MGVDRGPRSRHVARDVPVPNPGLARTRRRREKFCSVPARVHGRHGGLGRRGARPGAGGALRRRGHARARGHDVPPRERKRRGGRLRDRGDGGGGGETRWVRERPVLREVGPVRARARGDGRARAGR